MCANKDQAQTSVLVPDYTAVGFGNNPDLITNALKHLKDVQALSLSACVGASYNASTNQICFSVPIYGNVCITSPAHIPVNAQIKACISTCSHIIPTGVKGTIYVNGDPIWSGTIAGSC